MNALGGEEAMAALAAAGGHKAGGLSANGSVNGALSDTSSVRDSRDTDDNGIAASITSPRRDPAIKAEGVKPIGSTFWSNLSEEV